MYWQFMEIFILRRNPLRPIAFAIKGNPNKEKSVKRDLRKHLKRNLESYRNAVRNELVGDALKTNYEEDAITMAIEAFRMR